MITVNKSKVERPRVVIVGAGFGGLSAAKGLRRAPVDVTIIDKRNHHLFQPFLYQVATSALSGADIAVPIRHILRSQRNARIVLGEVIDVDTNSKTIRTDTKKLIPFDYLVLATGSRHSYFGNDQWAQYAPGLKSIAEATDIRSKILSALERAEIESDEALRRRLMTVVLVGGGPTGVELAGAIATLSRRVLRDDYRNIDPGNLRIILIEAGARILSTFPEKLSLRAKRELEDSGVEIRLNAMVKKIDSLGVHVGDEVIPGEILLWTAGVAAASPVGQWLKVRTDRSGRVRVNADLSVPGYQNIFVIGDTASVKTHEGRPVPGLAPAAIQQGQYVAKLIKSRTRSRDFASFPAFRYRDKGSLATLGKLRAVADLKRFQFAGFLAWLLWAVVHIAYLITFRNRFVVMLKWAFLFTSFHARDSLIITREEPLMDQKKIEQGKLREAG